MKESLGSYSILSYQPIHGYTFLDILGNNSHIYYSILESIDEYKLKNIYRFIFLRLLKIHKKFPEIPLLPLSKEPLTHSLLNQKMNEYIKNNKLLSILILQSIYHYKHPKLSRNS
jgi:hypothetical protein